MSTPGSRPNGWQHERGYPQAQPVAEPVPSRYAGADRGSSGCVGLAWPRHVFQ
jgi:hypothetical protein